MSKWVLNDGITSDDYRLCKNYTINGKTCSGIERVYQLTENEVAPYECWPKYGYGNCIAKFNKEDSKNLYQSNVI